MCALTNQAGKESSWLAWKPRPPLTTFEEHDMEVRIERTNGLVLMSPEELHAAVAQKDGEIFIRLSADALHRPGAFFRIHSENSKEAQSPEATNPT